MSAATLRVLGGAALELAGAPVTGRAAQRRRLALLALLAAAPARTWGRDRLISLLWPESDTEQARHLLAGAVYDIRRALGEEALLSRGDDVELGPAVTTDLTAFETALAAGDEEAALACYAGPFLDGFHVGDSAEFDRWADGERDRLARQHAATLETVARRCAAAGDAVGAVALWRRLAALDPYNSRIIHELMLALDAAGDRAAALQQARTHAIMLREEFEAEPDAAITELAERIRAGDVREPSVAQPTSAAEPPPAVQPAAAQPAVAAAAVLAAVPGPLPSAEPAVSDQAPPARRAVAAPWVMAALGILLAGWMLASGRAPWTTPVASQGPRGASIAVLPFRDLSGSAGHALLGDGLSDEIISTLSRIRGLHVAARSSSFMFRGDADARTVGRRLGVSHVLEGTVRGSADRLAVTARLIDTATGYEVWTRSFQAPLQMQNIIELQEQIAGAVVSAFEVEFGERPPPGALVAATTTDLDAFQEYVAGRHHFYRRTVDGLMTALRHFERAVQRDSSYAVAHAAIAEVYTLLGAYDYGVLPPRVAYPAARAAAERALELQPDLAEAYTALASVHFNFDWDWDAADRAFRRAQELNRGYAPAYHWHGLLHAARSRLGDARAAMLRGAELDPLSLVMSTAVARYHYFARDYERGIELYRRTLEADSTFITARLGLGITLLQAGRIDEAIAEFTRAQELIGTPVPVLHSLLGHAHGRRGDRATARQHLAELEAGRARGYFPAEYVALVHLGLGDRDAALASLELAMENRSGGIAYLGVEPMMDPLRGDPRFARLMQRAGL
jgi:TolB-like protein/DNA-binding SARP family transcriptional activator/tetratricopeptide (TPR) repeat protein